VPRLYGCTGRHFSCLDFENIVLRFALRSPFALAVAALSFGSVAKAAEPAAADGAAVADDAEISVAPAAPAAADSKEASSTPASSESPPAVAATAPVNPKAPEPTTPTSNPALGKEPSPQAEAPLVDIKGYVQGEYQFHQDSEQQLRQGGGLLNQNRFLIRRARLSVGRAWQYTSLELELDGNTNSGPSFGVNRAEASVFYKPDQKKGSRPYAQLTLGMFRLPFGFELPESSSQRWYMERSQMSRALFPSEIDVGARLSGEIAAFRYAIAVTNGEPLGERSGLGLQDPNLNKDVTFSVGARAKAAEAFELSGGISLNTGRGFHAGQSATKGTATWIDRNENGMVDINNNELVGTPGQAATTSSNFERWAVGADLQARIRTPLGDTILLGEIIAAKNLDRAFMIADPVPTNVDAREFGFYVGLLQQVTRYGLVGFRADFYDPNADAGERRAGRSVPLNNKIQTYSLVGGLTLPDRARLALQYDIIRDHLARDERGVPADLANNTLTLRLQVNL